MLVTVGIPTYNRAASLRRAIDSVLAQEGCEIRLVISDNASDDATASICRDLADRDRRIRYLRHQRNLGPTANFNTVLREAGGDLFMFLSDDDWLEAGYIARCAEVLERRPDVVSCGGRAVYRDEQGGAVAKGLGLQLQHPRPEARITHYFRHVDDNATFYGLMRTAAARALPPLRNSIGNDWLLVANLAVLGSVVTAEGATLNRTLGGTSAGFGRIAQVLGVRAIHGRLPFLAIAGAASADILWRSPVHRRLPLRRRLVLVAAIQPALLRRQAWAVLIVIGRLPVARHPYRVLKRAYEALYRRSGGRLRLRFPGHATAARDHEDAP